MYLANLDIDSLDFRDRSAIHSKTGYYAEIREHERRPSRKDSSYNSNYDGRRASRVVVVRDNDETVYITPHLIAPGARKS